MASHSRRDTRTRRARPRDAVPEFGPRVNRTRRALPQVFDADGSDSLDRDEFVRLLSAILVSRCNGLRLIMHTEAGRGAMLEFARTEHSDENVSFILAAEKWIAMVVRDGPSSLVGSVEDESGRTSKPPPTTIADAPSHEQVMQGLSDIAETYLRTSSEQQVRFFVEFLDDALG